MYELQKKRRQHSDGRRSRRSQNSSVTSQATVANDDDNVHEDGADEGFELHISEDFLEFLAQSEKHRTERGM